MLKDSFSKLHLHTRMWVISMIASWDNETKIRSLLQKYVGAVTRFKFVQTKWDSFFIAEFDTAIYIGHCGTRCKWAWLSNIMGWLKKGFHYGIANSMDKIFNPEIAWILRTEKPVRIGGQSRGGANALYSNLLLRERGVVDVESIGYSHPYIASKKLGIQRLKRSGVRHTHFDTDPFGQLSSDPTDDVGSLCSRHYGEGITLYGGSGPFDHSYLQINRGLIARSVNDSSGKMDADADFLASLGSDIIKK